MNFIDALKYLVDAASSYTDDLQDGLGDGTYDNTGNLKEVNEAIFLVESLLQGEEAVTHPKFKHYTILELSPLRVLLAESPMVGTLLNVNSDTDTVAFWDRVKIRMQEFCDSADITIKLKTVQYHKYPYVLFQVQDNINEELRDFVLIETWLIEYDTNK